MRSRGLGAAGVYLLVDLPRAQGDDVVFEVHDLASPTATTMTNVAELDVGARRCRFDLTQLL